MTATNDRQGNFIRLVRQQFARISEKMKIVKQTKTVKTSQVLGLKANKAPGEKKGRQNIYMDIRSICIL